MFVLYEGFSKTCDYTAVLSIAVCPAGRSLPFPSFRHCVYFQVSVFTIGFPKLSSQLLLIIEFFYIKGETTTKWSESETERSRMHISTRTGNVLSRRGLINHSEKSAVIMLVWKGLDVLHQDQHKNFVHWSIVQM